MNAESNTFQTTVECVATQTASSLLLAASPSRGGRGSFLPQQKQALSELLQRHLRMLSVNKPSALRRPGTDWPLLAPRTHSTQTHSWLSGRGRGSGGSTLNTLRDQPRDIAGCPWNKGHALCVLLLLGLGLDQPF